MGPLFFLRCPLYPCMGPLLLPRCCRSTRMGPSLLPKILLVVLNGPAVCSEMLPVYLYRPIVTHKKYHQWQCMGPLFVQRCCQSTHMGPSLLPNEPADGHKEAHHFSWEMLPYPRMGPSFLLKILLMVLLLSLRCSRYS